MLALSPVEALGWGALLVFICGWFFILGIFVGRGLVPVPGENETVGDYLAASESRPAVNPKPVKTAEKTSAEGNTQKKPAVQNTEKPEAPPRQEPVPPPVLDRPVGEHPVKAPAVEKTVRVSSGNQPPDQGQFNFTIQVAALKEEAYVDRFFQKLKEQNYTPHIVKVTGEGGETWYRLRCGQFTSREEAEPVIERLRKDGYSPILIQASDG